MEIAPSMPPLVAVGCRVFSALVQEAAGSTTRPGAAFMAPLSDLKTLQHLSRLRLIKANILAEGIPHPWS